MAMPCTSPDIDIETKNTRTDGISRGGTALDLKLEVVVVPVTDVDRAKRFYVEALGFRMDVDHRSETYEGGLGFRYRGAPAYRIVQLTPPGSACSIQIGIGITDATPGSTKGLYLVTSDLEGVRAQLVEHGVDVSEPFHFGPEGATPGIDPGHRDYNSFVTFDDPDGNGWLVQEIRVRAPGR
jgi:catechol 2,3-dioxygenase-like lactoylglutathione lyase family enzyme